MDITVQPASQAPVELLRPRDGETLVAGRQSVIAWHPTRDLASEGIREWEAFLSYDGGRHWPVRITPHLDIDRTSFRFLLPLAPSENVRLMLRFGDERREVGFVTPITLRSVLPASGAPQMSRVSLAGQRGEVARPGVPRVVLWVEERGGVRGSRITTAVWSRPGPGIAEAGARLPWPVATPPPTRDRGSATPPENGDPPRRVVPTSPPIGGTPLVCLAVLILLCRQNE